MLAIIVDNFVKRDLYILSRPAVGSIEDVGRQAAHAYSTEKFGLLRYCGGRCFRNLCGMHAAHDSGHRLGGRISAETACHRRGLDKRRNKLLTILASVGILVNIVSSSFFNSIGQHEHTSTPGHRVRHGATASAASRAGE